MERRQFTSHFKCSSFYHIISGSQFLDDLPALWVEIAFTPEEAIVYTWSSMWQESAKVTSFPGPTPHPSSLVNIFKNPQKKQGTTTSSVGLQAFPPLFVFSTFTPVISDRCEPHHETCQRDRRAIGRHLDASPSFWLPGNAPRDGAWHCVW